MHTMAPVYLNYTVTKGRLVLTSFPGVPTSMTLNDLKPSKYEFLVNFSRFRLQCTFSKL